MGKHAEVMSITASICASLKDPIDRMLVQNLAHELLRYYYLARNQRSWTTDIYVRDRHSGRIYRIGDDAHDQLTISDDGQLYYYNLQNGDGCSTGFTVGSGYEFVPNEDEYGYSMDPREVEDR